MPLNQPVLTGPGAGRTVSSGSGSSFELKLEGEQAGGEWAVVEWRLRAGDEPPIHTHTREDETLYVLEGAITAFVGEERIEVEAGSYAALPKDVPHGLTVRGDEVRLLVTLAPAGAEYFFVPRDENDADPARFGLLLQGSAMADCRAGSTSLSNASDSHDQQIGAPPRRNRRRWLRRFAGGAQACTRAGAALPGLAPVAMQEGRYAGRAVRRRPQGRESRPFRHRRRRRARN